MMPSSSAVPPALRFPLPCAALPSSPLRALKFAPAIPRLPEIRAPARRTTSLRESAAKAAAATSRRAVQQHVGIKCMARTTSSTQRRRTRRKIPRCPEEVNQRLALSPAPGTPARKCPRIRNVRPPLCRLIFSFARSPLQRFPDVHGRGPWSCAQFAVNQSQVGKNRQGKPTSTTLSA